MNPLYRRMFQQPGASRQPMGILASSPELANVAAQRQPMRMNQGGAVNLQTIMGELKQLQQQGDTVSLRRIASDPKFPDVVKRAASNLADSLRPDSVPLIEVGDVNLGNALSDATNRNPIGQSAGGKERSAAITPVGNVGDVNLSNALSDFSGRKPIGQSAGGQERSAALRAVPGKIGAAIGEGFDELTRVRGPALKDVEGPLPDSPFKNMLDMFRSDASAAPQSVQSPPEFTPSTTMDSSIDSMSRIGSSMSQTMLNKIREARGLPPVAATTDSLVGSARVASPTDGGIFSVLAKNQAETVDALKKADEQSGILRDPTMLVPQLGPDYVKPYDETGADVNLGVKVTEVAKTPAEVLAEAKGTTPTQDAAAADAKKETDKKPSGSRAKTDSAIANIKDVFAKAKQGLQGDKKVSPSQASNPEVADAFAVQYGAFADPEDVDLNKIQDAIDSTFGDKKDFTESKKDAFWMGLMQAGLAMAAGESDNAMTNIAKGLSFGLTQYGKDIGELNEQQREDEKERRLFKTQMIRDERSANIAMAANKNQWTAAQNKMKQADATEKRTQAWREKSKAIDSAYAMATLETNVMKAIADLELKQGTLDEANRSNLETEAIARLKETPDTLKIAREFGWLDEDNNVTEKGIAEAGATLKQVIMDAEVLKARGTTSKLTNEDRLTNSLKNLIGGAGTEDDRARVLASPSGQAAIKDAGGDIVEAAKIMFDKMNPNQESTDPALLAEVESQGLVWDPQARAGNGRQGAYVPAK